MVITMFLHVHNLLKAELSMSRACRWLSTRNAAVRVLLAEVDRITRVKGNTALGAVSGAG
eukprot:m.175871 g.175871  ORF g.175871 m.175871 type:complete len:60 (+) comp24417_c0_seq2:536-715(+)